MSDHPDVYVRSDFYRRLRDDMTALIERGYIMEGREPEMVIKVNIQEALSRLRFCPACGAELKTLDAELARSCEHGDFVPTDVWGDGDVEFKFTLLATQHGDEEPDEPEGDHHDPQ